MKGIEEEDIARGSIKKMIKSSFLKSGMTGIIRISAKKAICLDKFSVLSSIGRFTLRDENR